MSGVNSVEHAERVFRDLLGARGDGDPAPSHREFLEAVRRFSAVEFDVPEDADTDGFLFDYGAYRSLPVPGFHVAVTRQFEIVTASGDHDCYVQLGGTYIYPIEPELEELKGVTSWWFRNASTPFDDWFGQVINDPVWAAVSGRPILQFVIDQESV